MARLAERERPHRFDAAEVARVSAHLRAFGLPADDRLGGDARARLAALVESSAADARPPLDSPHRGRRYVAQPLKALLRRLVWSRTGPALERQAEFNVALIRVAAELLASRSERPGASRADAVAAPTPRG